MKKIKIAYILHGLATGGTESFVINVIQRLDSERYDIAIILAVNEGARQQREDEAEKLGVKIYRTNDLDGVQKIASHYSKLISILKKTGPYDVVHANMDLFNGINLRAAKKAGVKQRICHAHVPQSQSADQVGKPFVIRTYQKTMRRLIQNNATICLGCSESANEYLYGPDWKMNPRCAVVYNGIDLNKYRMVKVDRETFLESNHLPTDRRYIITVGRMSAVKNPLFALDVIKQLHEKNPEYAYLWVGDGEMRAQVKNRIDELKMNDYVWLLGVRKDIPEVLQVGEAFLLTSIFEAFAIVLLEGQVSGLPCICSSSIPRNADLGRCEFVSLHEGADRWAETIDRCVNRDRQPQLDEEKVASIDAERIAQVMEQYYSM
ncbi:MAG: glycosyltransferase [Eubacterium sp.]|nr:glycosyltransferase [Eubacterium sp.]